MARRRRDRRAWLRETDYGRRAGWFVEREGEVIAVLTEPRTEDMFWNSYRMEVVAADPRLRERMYSAAFWAGAEAEGLVYRNRETGEEAPFAFPALDPFPEPGRLMLRGLYLTE